ncbi:MAG: GNAT family N-acetyltransferase [Vulcanimicrobiaceae bacterium]
MKLADATLVVDEEIALLPRRAADADELFALVDRHRSDLRSWLSWVDATRSRGDMRRFAQFAAAQFEQLAGFDYSISYRGALAGSIGLYHLEWLVRSAHIGYWLSPDARGHGVVTRAVGRLTAHAFSRLDIHRLEIRAIVENRPSRAVAERAGFAFEGILRGAELLHGSYHDLALYAKLTGEDAAASPPRA